MKRILALLALAFLWNNAAPGFAQETVENELELVRQLRNKGWNDLAQTKIEELLKRGDPTLNATLPLELARIKISSARQKDPEQRFTLFTEARDQLQKYIAANQGKAQAALASAELARLTSYHAQALLSKALREEDNRTRHASARPAEAMFTQAGKELEAAAKILEAALAEPANANLKAVLQRELTQARFDKAINLFDQARTYIDKSKDQVNLQRTTVIEKASKAFFELRSDESSEIGWLANAWLMKCFMEQTDPDNTYTYYKKVMDRKDDKNAQPSIQPAVRLVRYFHMQDVTPRLDIVRSDESETIGLNYIASKTAAKKKPTPTERLHEVQKEGEAWLKAYPSYLRTYEGQGVLFELGQAYLAEATIEKSAALAAPNFDKAIKHLDELGAQDGDLPERARLVSMSIKYKRLDLKAVLMTFDENMMKAMIERRSVIELSQKLETAMSADRKTLEAERKRHLKEVIVALSRALNLTTSKTPVQKVDDARFYLTGAYLAYGDPYRAVIISESLARAKPPTRRSSEGAATALQTYSALQNRHPDDPVLRQRLQDLAQFVLSPENQRLWGSDPVTGLANYHLALSAKRENDPKKALAHLEKLRPEFDDYIYTQGQAVFIAESARERAEDKAEKKFYLDAARAAMNRMGKLNAKDESSSVIAMYFFAKLENAKYLYLEAIEQLNAREELKTIKKCSELTAYVKGLAAEFEQVPPYLKDDSVPMGRISKQNHEQLQFSMHTWLKYADLALAETRFRSDTLDRFDQVLKATDKVVNDTLDLAKKVKPTDPIVMKDYRVTGDILGLALRANVQKGNVDRGKAILDVLKRLSGPEGEKGGNPVAVLLNDIAGQIRRMTAEKDPALKVTKGHYTAFLDEIAKDYEARGYDNQAAIMIAHAFNSLGDSRRAAEAFSKFKATHDIEKKIEKKKVETDEELKARQDWEEQNNRYWSVQVEYIRALRASKEQDKDAIAKAEKALETLLKHPNAIFKIQAMMERNLMMEFDQDKYREAALLWQQFLGMPALKNTSNADVAKIYFTGYFHYTRAVYKMATKDPLIKDRPKLVNAAANMIVKLEFTKDKEGKPGVGWGIAGPMYEELLKEEKQLKEAYDKAKAALLKGGAALDVRREERALNMHAPEPAFQVWHDAPRRSVGHVSNVPRARELHVGNVPHGKITDAPRREVCDAERV